MVRCWLILAILVTSAPGPWVAVGAKSPARSEGVKCHCGCGETCRCCCRTRVPLPEPTTDDEPSYCRCPIQSVPLIRSVSSQDHETRQTFTVVELFACPMTDGQTDGRIVVPRSHSPPDQLSLIQNVVLLV